MGDAPKKYRRRHVVVLFLIAAAAVAILLQGQALRKMSSHHQILNEKRMKAMFLEGWSVSTPDKSMFSLLDTKRSVNTSHPILEPTLTLVEKRNNETSGIQNDNVSVIPWRRSRQIPQWMKEYFQWHQDSLKRLNANNWNEYNYLIVRCLQIDRRCGGGADRLKAIPMMILLAHRLKRLLFYKWDTPAPLTEFLMPPIDGLNWTWPPGGPNHIPALAKHKFESRAYIAGGSEINYFLNYTDPDPRNVVKRKPNALHKISSLTYQSHHHGSIQYNFLRSDNRTDATYDQVFSDVWHSVFVPTPPVQEKISSRMKELDLRPNEFHAIHLRSQYIRKLPHAGVKRMASDAIHCLSQLLHERSLVNSTLGSPVRPLSTNTTIFVASDGDEALQATLDYARSKGLVRLVEKKPNTSEPTLHLDRGTMFLSQKPNEWTHYDPPAYYSTFVDLYVLSKARCIVFSQGNYGRWSNLLSSDISCHYDAGDKRRPPCTWKTPQ